MNTMKNEQEILEALEKSGYDGYSDDHPKPWSERLVVGSRSCQKFHLESLVRQIPLTVKQM